jgi:prevent-host-death family protein
MTTEHREIPLRELRNNISRVLREVEGGACFRVTVRGRPVAELRPIEDEARPRRWVPREVIERIIRESELDYETFAEIRRELGERIDEI